MVSLAQVEVYQPRKLDEALKLLDEKKGKARLIAGGTDLILQLKDGAISDRELIDLSRLRDELRYIKAVEGRVHLGALTTYSDIIESSLTNSQAPMLVEASRTVGAHQLQNTATIGGNLANASPAGDSIPPLFALDASVTVLSIKDERTMPIEKFFLDYRQVDRKPNELIKEISFDSIKSNEQSSFLKFGAREANAISIVSVAARTRLDRPLRKFQSAKIALGAVAPTVIRAKRAENYLSNSTIEDNTFWQAATLASEEAKPISDIRASSDYRRSLVKSLVYESLLKVSGIHP